MKTTNNSTFNKDITRALVKEMKARGLSETAAAYVCSNYDFTSYLLEGTLSHLEKQIYQVETAAGN